MPRETEFQQLLENCLWTINTFNGVKGMTVTGPSGNSIFLPFAGCNYDDGLSDNGYRGYYWSGMFSIYDEGVSCLSLDEDGDVYLWDEEIHVYGQTVRPVKDKPKEY